MPHIRPLLLVGNPNDIHTAAHFLTASQLLGLQARICDTNLAFSAPRLLAKINWWLGHRPTHLVKFSNDVLTACQELRPQWLLTTGLAPVQAPTLKSIGQMGIRRINFLTDDPWNPLHRASWFLKALPLYDQVFSPRRHNLNDLAQQGCVQVNYLPFAYSPEIHFPEPALTEDEKTFFDSDVVFAGGADSDRIAYIAPLLQAGLKVSLYGGYWDRFAETRGHTRGHANPSTLRKAIAGAKVCLCLVRRANRDGHVMRSFEIPAMGGCMLVEDTDEHRLLFGEEGQAVAYFGTIPQMIDKLRWLISHGSERSRLAHSAYKLIVEGKNTYKDRLSAMLGLPVETT